MILFYLLCLIEVRNYFVVKERGCLTTVVGQTSITFDIIKVF